MAIEIAPIREEHIEGYHAALDTVAREKHYLTFLEAPPLDALRSYAARAIRGDFIQHVAVADGRVVGWCDIDIPTRPVLRHTGTLGIGIVPGYRDQGLGARLILSALDAARQRGLVRVSLYVRTDNTRAVRLYERLGFVHEGRLRRELRVDGIDYDNFTMAIFLDVPAQGAGKSAS